MVISLSWVRETTSPISSTMPLKTMSTGEFGRARREPEFQLLRARPKGVATPKSAATSAAARSEKAITRRRELQG